MNMIEKYFANQDYIQNDFTQYRLKQKNAYRKRNPIANGVLNHLYLCPKCRRVWKRFNSGSGEQIMYLDQSFPKHQDHKICEECK